jgi:hypothetical protein
MFYTSAWCINNEEEFRKAIPFELLGKSMQAHGSTVPFYIIILEGMELLSTRYVNSLKAYGFVVVDYCAGFSDILKRYPEIDRAYTRYERNCFLRWIAFHQLVLSHIHEYPQFWHLDGDVILHTSLDELAADTKGKTFMLQGCPVFLTTATIQWFELYETELQKLNDDIIAYSNQAYQEKAACIKNDLSLANQSPFSNPLRSDQDLLEYLVSAKKIIQNDAGIIYDSKYYFIQNPLVIGLWHSIQCKKDSDFIGNQKSQIFIGDKQVPFTHYQNTFANVAGVYLLLLDLLVPRFFVKKILAYEITDTGFKTTFVFKVLFRIYRNRAAGPGRYAVIRKIMAKKEQHGLTGLLNLLKNR